MPESYVEWKGWDASQFGSFSAEEAAYSSEEIKRRGISSVLGLRVAEIGFGNGGFAGWVRREGGHWVGRELSEELLARARAGGFQVIGSNEDFTCAFSSGRIDLVVAFDVVEHLTLPAIRSFLSEAFTVLAASGILVIRIPSGDSPFSGAIYWGDLTHKTLLGSHAMQMLAKESGLEIHQIRPPALPVFGVGLRRATRRAAVLLVRWVCYRVIGWLLMDYDAAVISPNMVVVMRRARSHE